MERIICFGDSITACSSLPDSHRWVSHLQAALDAAAPGHFQVFNRGVGGDTTYDGLKRFDSAVLPLLPGWVLIEFGFNDASVSPGRRSARVPLPAYREFLEDILRLVRKQGGRPILIGNHPIRKDRPTPQGNRRSYWRNGAPYRPVVHELAKKTRTPLIDLEAALSTVPLEELVTEDGLHLSASGCCLMPAPFLPG